MNLACVIHRYGADIAGGSEAHCRALAERLAATHDVTVLTTCARDYLTWENHYPPGQSTIGPVTVRRFPVARTRRLARLAEVTERALSERATDADQDEWFRENGPDAPQLHEHLRAHGAEYDRILFWSFRYDTAYRGVPIVADRAVLVPTAEEDPMLWLPILRRFFARPSAYFFLTPEEADLVAERCDGPLPPSIVIGGGIEPAAAADPAALDALHLPRPFALYLGRIDRNKGCESLFSYYQRYAGHCPSAMPLVLAGPAAMAIPEHPLIRPLGYVSDAVRDALLSQAAVLLVPSPYESLSLALLEGWNHARPAIVNARCRVLKGQVLRADGGLHYRNVQEFAECLAYAAERPEVMAAMGRQGLEYVEREYRWPHVMARVEAFLASYPTGWRPHVAGRAGAVLSSLP